MKKKKGIKNDLIKPRNFLVPILRFKKGGDAMDKKKELDRKLCRLDNWSVTFKEYQ